MADWFNELVKSIPPREEEIGNLLNAISLALGIEWDYNTLVNIDSRAYGGPDTVIKGITEDGEKARFVCKAGQVVSPYGRGWKVYIGRKVYQGKQVFEESIRPLWTDLKKERDPDWIDPKERRWE